MLGSLSLLLRHPQNLEKVRNEILEKNVETETHFTSLFPHASKTLDTKNLLKDDTDELIRILKQDTTFSQHLETALNYVNLYLNMFLHLPVDTIRKVLPHHDIDMTYISQKFILIKLMQERICQTNPQNDNLGLNVPLQKLITRSNIDIFASLLPKLGMNDDTNILSETVTFIQDYGDLNDISVSKFPDGIGLSNLFQALKEKLIEENTA